MLERYYDVRMCDACKELGYLLDTGCFQRQKNVMGLSTGGKMRGVCIATTSRLQTDFC